MRQNLKNYTTQIDAFKTISEIQQLLAKAGASAVMTDYDQNGYIVALSFKIRLDNSDIAFRLPTDWRPVLEKMKQDKARGGKGSDHIRLTEDQALRVAWRITRDWVDAQCAFIETMMVTTAQVFLPYAVTANGQSLYEYIEANTNLLLGSGTERHGAA